MSAPARARPRPRARAARRGGARRRPRRGPRPPPAPRSASRSTGTAWPTSLGGGFAFTSTITNAGARAATDLVAHLNIASLDPDAYVDPEDWSPRRTQYLAPLRAGRSAKLSWRVTAVGGGRVGVYITVLPARGPQTAAAGLAVGEPIDVRVAERRTLNNDGVLLVVLGVPGALALAMVGTAARRRRT